MFLFEQTEFEIRTAHEYVRLAVKCESDTKKKVKSLRREERKERKTERLRPRLEPPHL